MIMTGEACSLDVGNFKKNRFLLDVVPFQMLNSRLFERRVGCCNYRFVKITLLERPLYVGTDFSIIICQYRITGVPTETFS